MGEGGRMSFHVSAVGMIQRSVEGRRSHHEHVEKNGDLYPGEGYGLFSDCMTWCFGEEYLS